MPSPQIPNREKINSMLIAPDYVTSDNREAYNYYVMQNYNADDPTVVTFYQPEFNYTSNIPSWSVATQPFSDFRPTYYEDESSWNLPIMSNNEVYYEQYKAEIYPQNQRQVSPYDPNEIYGYSQPAWYINTIEYQQNNPPGATMPLGETGGGGTGTIQPVDFSNLYDGSQLTGVIVGFGILGANLILVYVAIKGYKLIRTAISGK